MNVFTALLLISIVSAGVATVLYWILRGTPPPLFTSLVALFSLAIVGASLMLERPESSFKPDSPPTAIVVAFDLSPSMLSVPDPGQHPDFPARYTRARNVLQNVFTSLEEHHEPVIISLIGFTQKAEILMGWDSRSAQLQEVLRYGLSPDLFDSSGTNIEAAIETVVRLFEMLPDESRDLSRKIVFIVSDGENTTSKETLSYAIAELAGQPFQVFALQVGLQDINEGVPKYDDRGEFLGFQSMSGNTYSTPDQATMLALSRSTAQAGLFVRAEQDDAIAQILRSIRNDGAHGANLPGPLLMVLSLFFLSVAVCARVLE